MFWPLSRSCLGEESLPAAFLSREPIGKGKVERFPLITKVQLAIQPTKPCHSVQMLSSDLPDHANNRPSPAAAGKHTYHCAPRLQGKQVS